MEAENSTIAIQPIPQTTSVDQIRNNFKMFNIKNVHVQGKTAYVEFHDASELQNLQLIFSDYTIPQLNNAKIDIAENFDWTKIQNKPTQSKIFGYHPREQIYEDLTDVDIKNLVVIQNCDRTILTGLSVQNIRKIFVKYSSINRIVKRDNQVVIQFLDPSEIELLDIQFEEHKVSQLGNETFIEKGQLSKITPDQFRSEWSKLNAQQSQLTQATTKLEEEHGQFLGYGSDIKSNSQEVLHQGIIPPFDKKTSMQVNFLSQQSKIGFGQQLNKPQPIHQANTKQQLDYTSELQIQGQQQQNRFGYQEMQRKQLRSEEQARKQKQAELQKLKMQQEQRKRKEEEQRIRKQQEELRKEEERIKIQQEMERKQKEELKIRQQQEAKKSKAQEQLSIRKFEQEKAKKAYEEQQKKIQQEEEAKRRRQSLLLEKDLKQKLQAQRQKLKKEEQQATSKKQAIHNVPTEGENAEQQAQFIKQAGTKIQQKIVKMFDSVKEKIKQELKPHSCVRSDTEPQRSIIGKKKQVSKTLITITLAIWVIFLLLH